MFKEPPFPGHSSNPELWSWYEIFKDGYLSFGYETSKQLEYKKIEML